MIDISVIIPIYKVEKYIRSCIDSILVQTHKNFELILVNDGSPDKCGSICDDYKRRDNRVKVIHQQNQGVGMARNKGLEMACGKYVYFCDSDDYIKPKLFEDNLVFAERYKVDMVLFGNYEEDNGKLKPISYQKKFLSSQFEFRNEFFKLFTEHNLHVLWNKFYKREIILQNNIRFSDKKIGEDSSFNKQIYRNLNSVFINDQVYYYHITRKESAQNKFVENRFEMRYDETEELENLIKEWQKYDELKSMIMKDWIKTFFIGISNIFNREESLSYEIIKQKVTTIVTKPKIKSLFEEVSYREVDGLFKKINFIFLKNNLIALTYASYILKNKVKNKNKY